MDALWPSLVQLLNAVGWPSWSGVPVSDKLDLPSLLALAAVLGWASGFRLYAVVFLTGLAGVMGWLVLPPGLQLLQHPAMLIASGCWLSVEFFADKIPGLDSLWDIVHSVVRIPAGAALAAGALGADSGTMTMVAALMGGSLAATSQAAKTTTRAAINTSPEPFSNVAMSLLGDSIVPASLWLSWAHPAVFFAALTVVLIVMVALIWWFAKFLRQLARRVSGWFATARPSA